MKDMLGVLYELTLYYRLVYLTCICRFLSIYFLMCFI